MFYVQNFSVCYVFYLRNFFFPSLCTFVVLPNYYFCVSFSPCMVGVLLSKLCISFSLYGRFITYKVFTLSLCKRVCYFRIVCISLSLSLSLFVNWVFYLRVFMNVCHVGPSLSFCISWVFSLQNNVSFFLFLTYEPYTY